MHGLFFRISHKATNFIIVCIFQASGKKMANEGNSDENKKGNSERIEKFPAEILHFLQKFY